jgi:hypothetical protein
MQLVQLPHTLLVSSQLVLSEAQLVLSFTTPMEPLSQLMSPLLLQHELTILPPKDYSTNFCKSFSNTKT